MLNMVLDYTKRFIFTNWDRLLVRLKNLLVRTYDIIQKIIFSNNRGNKYTLAEWNENDINSSCIFNKSNLEFDDFVEIDKLEHYIKHEFNLLGSNWVKVEYLTDKTTNKISKYAFPQPKDKTEHIKSQICLHLNIDKKELGNYQPIDWHLDFISGYRFR